MTRKELVKTAGLCGTMLICMIFACASNTTIGTAVPDSVAAEMRGGVTHNDSFTSDADLYCEGGSCKKGINAYDSENGTAHHKNDSCGDMTGCDTYTVENSCNSE